MSTETATAMSTAKFEAPLHLPIIGTTNDGALPLDLLYDFLLRLPAKPLCRFRAVCKAWRSLLCHPDFIAAHDYRHPCQRRAVGVHHYGRCSPDILVRDMDTGFLIKRLSATHQNHRPLSLDRAVCVHGSDMRLHLLDHVTGAVSLLPRPAAPRDCAAVSYSLGRVASTGECKVLVVVTLVQHRGQVCKILTLTGDQQLWSWRATGRPPLGVVSPPTKSYVNCRETTVVEGVAYFLAVDDGMANYNATDRIMAYDLDNEAWWPAAIQGPAGTSDVGLAGLDGRLVVCHDDRLTCVQLWFLVDPDQALWSVLHRMIMPCHGLGKRLPWSSQSRFHEYADKPLAVLQDGKIVMRMRVKKPLGSPFFPYTVLRLYDPRTGASTDAARMSDCHDVTIYTCSMLHSGRGRTAYHTSS